MVHLITGKHSLGHYVSSVTATLISVECWTLGAPFFLAHCTTWCVGQVRQTNSRGYNRLKLATTASGTRQVNCEPKVCQSRTERNFLGIFRKCLSWAHLFCLTASRAFLSQFLEPDWSAVHIYVPHRTCISTPACVRHKQAKCNVGRSTCTFQ